MDMEDQFVVDSMCKLCEEREHLFRDCTIRTEHQSHINMAGSGWIQCSAKQMTSSLIKLQTMVGTVDMDV